MLEEAKELSAKKIYDTAISVLDKRGWHYSTEEDMIIRLKVKGEDLPIDLVLVVDKEKQILQMLSPLPFEFSEEKRVEGSIATCAINYNLLYGNFDYNFDKGNICYRMIVPFHDSEIGFGLIDFLVSCICSLVDDYNDKLLALGKGYIDINEFMEKLK